MSEVFRPFNKTEPYIADDGGMIFGPWGFTPEGGLAVKMVSGEALAKGNLVRVKNAADNTVEKTPASTYGTIGAVYNTVTAAGKDVWVVVSGMADVLAKNAVDGIAGVYLAISDVAGRGNTKDGTATGENLGRVLEDKADGVDVLVRCLLRPSMVEAP